jgi:hypothetical protein
MATAVPTGSAQQPAVCPRPSQGQGQGWRGAVGDSAQEPGGARPDTDAHSARWAQQRQQPHHGASHSGVGGAGAQRPTRYRPPEPEPGEG